jgi:hypothetical protein
MQAQIALAALDLRRRGGGILRRDRGEAAEPVRVLLARTRELVIR